MIKLFNALNYLSYYNDSQLIPFSDWTIAEFKGKLLLISFTAASRVGAESN